MNRENKNIWDFSLQVSRDLRRWNFLNLLVGVLLVSQGGFWRGFGSQNIAWGLINIAIAVFGTQAQKRRRNQIPRAGSASVQRTEARNLKRILRFNAALDVLYMLGGYRFANRQPWNERLQRGIGFGIVLQGCLLLIFDLWKAARVPKDI